MPQRFLVLRRPSGYADHVPTGTRGEVPCNTPPDDALRSNNQCFVRTHNINHYPRPCRLCVLAAIHRFRVLDSYCCQYWATPPSANSSTPLTYLLSSEARNTPTFP